MNTEILNQLEEIAFKKTVPFCYNDYIECPTGRCPQCGSDDLMRLLPGNGCEYGTFWVIKELLSEALTPADLEEAFEQSISDCYSETVTVGWLQLDPVTVLKEMDPTAWRIARDEYIDNETEEGNLLTFDNGSTYYWKHDVDNFIEKEY